MKLEWNRENYERSATSRAWACTPYDAGWEESAKYGEDLPASEELRAIFEEEMALGGVPDWAEEILSRMMSPLPMCGHYAFPRPVLQICEAIGAEKAPAFVCGCYSADGERKRRLAYYVYCLDAWLKDAPLDLAQAELAMRGDTGKDWPAILAAIYRTLGSPTETKRLLVGRLIHRLRWWIKTLIWEDDHRDRFMLDVYSGDARGDEARYGAYGNSPYGDPFFAELRLPEIEEMSRRIRETVPGGEKLLWNIECTWLCAPKAFRYVEKLVAEIGRIEGDASDAPDAPFQCEDVMPDFDACRARYAALTDSLSRWLDGDDSAMPELGRSTPAKRWMARILRQKLRLYEVHNNFGQLVGLMPGGRSGAQAA